MHAAYSGKPVRDIKSKRLQHIVVFFDVVATFRNSKRIFPNQICTKLLKLYHILTALGSFQRSSYSL